MLPYVLQEWVIPFLPGGGEQFCRENLLFSGWVGLPFSMDYRQNKSNKYMQESWQTRLRGVLQKEPKGFMYSAFSHMCIVMEGFVTLEIHLL